MSGCSLWWKEYLLKAEGMWGAAEESKRRFLLLMVEDEIYSGSTVTACCGGWSAAAETGGLLLDWMMVGRRCSRVNQLTNAVLGWSRSCRYCAAVFGWSRNSWCWRFMLLLMTFEVGEQGSCRWCHSWGLMVDGGVL